MSTCESIKQNNSSYQTITYYTCSDQGLLDSDQIGCKLSSRTTSTDPKSSQSGKSPTEPVSQNYELAFHDALEHPLTKSLLPRGKGSTSAFLNFYECVISPKSRNIVRGSRTLSIIYRPVYAYITGR
ncbi:hypothetical protein CY34DRAFT_330788 [Suillus luteus UH-Slu-Lm8-n1]|uniref:Uncharacterized protein n=1 Tax=Suillus luteus UH-Slu-Lm8-n1 TaxID=930992 RepID=A0A0D0BB73_9AGAM|nr:hypothetical protein CY34DRAFT_330788 [Suillus luteus UH-Slu-Lm8-n1]